MCAAHQKVPASKDRNTHHTAFSPPLSALCAQPGEEMEQESKGKPHLLSLQEISNRKNGLPFP